MRDRGLSDSKSKELELKIEIIRLNKIIQALMDRAESGAGAQGSDYRLFQASITLEDPVRTRKAELEVAVADNEKINRALSVSEAKYRDLFQTTRDAILILDPSSGSFLSPNSGALEMFGAKDEAEMISRKPWEFSPERQPDGCPSAEKARKMIKVALRDGSNFFEWMHTRLDGTQFPADVLLTRAVCGDETLIYATVRDISERKQTEDRIALMARDDALTGLPNRRVFVEVLQQTIARAQRHGGSFAILILDVDHLKDVNDTLGHPVGDLLLVAIAERLKASVRVIDTIARFGGDKFAIILTGICDPVDAALVSDRLLDATRDSLTVEQAVDLADLAANKILNAVSDLFELQGNRIYSGTTIGIVVYGSDSLDAEAMLSRADIALTRAKSEVRGSYKFFDEAMDLEVRSRVRLSAEIRAAIALDQFFLMYQPQVDIKTNRIVGLEALVRWNHPTRGVVGPGHFIPAAEQNGLIVPLGLWVMREASRQTKRWLDAGIAPPRVAINLSGVQFKKPLELEKNIAMVLAESDLPAQHLELELTESVLMEAAREHNDVLVRLRKSGHHIAIDDFGSGYSSLAYLCRYPVDRIKIAQSFIAGIGKVAQNDVIVRTALRLARELKLEVVVEGVETAEQFKILKSWGCRIVQGYYFARPQPVQDVTSLLRIGGVGPGHTVLTHIAPSV